MTDDPWDAENPDSLTRSAVLKKDGSNLSPAFLRLLREALKSEPEMKDFNLEDGSPFRVDVIRSMLLTTPRYEEPSRLMTKLQISFSCSAALKAGHIRPEEDGGELDIRDLLGKLVDRFLILGQPPPRVPRRQQRTGNRSRFPPARLT